MKRLLFFLITLTFIHNIFAQFDSSKLEGTYQSKSCTFKCEIIKLNKDFSFEFISDEAAGRRTKGNWYFISEHEIHLKSFEEQLNFRVNEKQKSGYEKILIHAIDYMGAIYPGIIIKTKYLGDERQFITDENGNCEIPITNKFEIINGDYKGDYYIKDTKSNVLTLVIKSQKNPFVDIVLFFKNGQLVFDNDYPETDYIKLSKKKSLKLFPEN